MKFRCAGLTPESIVDGPGLRFTVWTQGCLHHCKGCHNQHTWDFDGGYDSSVERVLEEAAKDKLLCGVTLSGGEPFTQAKPMAELARRIHAFEGAGLSVIAYTGFLYEELIAEADDTNGYAALLKECDYLIDGPFILEQRSLDLKFRGSRNQRFIDVKRSLEAGRVIALTDEELSLM